MQPVGFCLMPFTIAMITFCLPMASVAQTRLNSAESFEKKTKMEQLISERMEKAITVSLDKGTFTVAVSVKIAPIPISKKETPVEPETSPVGKRPEDLMMGLLNAEELIKNYQKEIEELRLVNENKEKVPKETQYEVQEIQINVGLIDTFDDQYIGEFRTWLNKKAQADFGSLAKVTVGKIKRNPTIIPPPTQLEMVKEFQLLLSALVGIVGLILASLLFRGFRSSPQNDAKSMQLQLSGNPLPQAPAQLSEGLSREKKSEISMIAEMKSLRDLMNKVASLVAMSNLNINKIIESWLDAGGEGFQKTAILYDAVLTGHLDSQQDEGPLRILRSIQIPENFKEQVAQAFTQMKELAPEHKTIILEAVYWDLLSLQTIGDKYLKQPFAFAREIKGGRLKQVLKSQPDRIKALTLLALPSTSKISLLGEMSFDEKKDLFNKVFDIETIQKQELEQTSEFIKSEVQSFGSQTDHTSAAKLLPSILQALNGLDEIKLLDQLREQRPKEALLIRSEWPTLAFFSEWKPEKQKAFLAKCSSDQIEILAACLPNTQAAILNSVTPRVKEMVSDALRINQKLDEAIVNKTLKEMREKLLSVLDSKEFKLTDLYQETGQAEPDESSISKAS